MKWALAMMCVLAAPAWADDDPRVLFAAGRYAAAADVFEHRWQATGDATDGINAVVAWRTAGRYARAIVLLSRVRTGKHPPAADVAATADALAQRLDTLTARATLPKLPDTAVVEVDSDPAERLGDAIVLDVGEHDVAIAQDGCARFVWHVTAYAGARVAVPYEPDCDRRGALHVLLDGDARGAFAVDGARHVAIDHEATVALQPGVHHLAVAAGARPVVAEDVAIDAKQTATVRVRYPWRARGVGFILGITSEARAGQVMTGTAGALTVGLWSSRFRATFDGGAMISDTPGLRPGAAGPGHPWIADTAALHLWDGPLWQRRLGAYELALDFDPIAARFDEIRAVSYFGIRTVEAFEPRVRSWSFLPLALSIDGPYVHVEVTWWPISVLTYHGGNSGEAAIPTGVGSELTVLAGWRL